MTKIVTSCKDCKWAEYDGKTQNGCSFDLISKYNDAGILVTEAYDDDKEFNVIDRICVYSRHKDSNQTFEQVKSAIIPHYQAIYIVENAETAEDDFSFCLKSLKNQVVPPSHITIVKKFEVDIQPFKFTKLLAKSGIPWRYQDCVDKETSELDLIDICIDKIVFPYYMIIRKTGIDLHLDFSTWFNELINEKFRIFSYLEGNEVEIFTTTYHKQLGGNSFKPLRDKIKEDEQLSKLVFRIEELCISN